MKKAFYLTIISLTVFGLLFSSCSGDDDNAEVIILATPTLEVTASSVSITERSLEITIKISSQEALPSGTLEFKIDGTTINSFPLKKGTNTYTTDFIFDDTEEHSAGIIYSFNDGREPVNKNIKVRKQIQDNSQKSVKSDWIDF